MYVGPPPKPDYFCMDQIRKFHYSKLQNLILFLFQNIFKTEEVRKCLPERKMTAKFYWKWDSWLILKILRRKDRMLWNGFRKEVIKRGSGHVWRGKLNRPLLPIRCQALVVRHPERVECRPDRILNVGHPEKVEWRSDKIPDVGHPEKAEWRLDRNSECGTSEEGGMAVGAGFRMWDIRIREWRLDRNLFRVEWAMLHVARGTVYVWGRESYVAFF